MRIARLSIVVLALAAGLPLAAVGPSVGQRGYTVQQVAPELIAAARARQAAADRAVAERAARQAAADRTAAQRAARQAAVDRAAAERAAHQAAADRAAAEEAARQAAADRAVAEEGARQAAADRAAAEEAERRAAADRAAVDETATPGNETAANEVAPETSSTKAPPPAITVTEDGPGNTIAGNDRNGPREEASWLVPLLIGAGAMLALVLAGLMLKRILSPTPEPDPEIAYEPEPEPEPEPAETPQPATPPPLIRPSLDPGEGGVAGDEIEAAGPDVRLGATLEPGATLFDGNEPEVRDE